jgi:transcriptional regulator with XRE-family HTH domain
MEIAFAACTVTFIDENDEGSGVMMREASAPSQIRAARALLGWSHAGVAKASGVSEATVMRFETEHGVLRRASVKVIFRALGLAGIIFIEEEGDMVGVSLRKST